MGTLGDRMKGYEKASSILLHQDRPIIARVDGRAFHSFTKGMARPYDFRMLRAMRSTVLNLAKETNACIAYTQSDEITLVWYKEDPNSQIWFSGKHSKMVSQLGALATLFFYRECLRFMPEYALKLPTFDARAWNVPSVTEASNALLWRENDAVKNSISMAAHAYYSHKELHGCNGKKKLEMLAVKGLDWNEYPNHFKKGIFVQNYTFKAPFSRNEISKLPEKHEARITPDLKVGRKGYRILQLENNCFKDAANKIDIVFNGANPVFPDLRP